jgi:NitT/TauT family transport system substrate-binding protein
MMQRRTFLKGVGTTTALGLSMATVLRRDARAQTSETITVRGAYAAPGLSFAGIFLANRAGLWEKNRLHVDLKQLQGGPLAIAALTNHEVDFIGVASTDPIITWDKGIKTLAVGAFTGALVAQFTARKDWMEKVGISPSSPVQDKIRAFKGARIGASTIGGGPAQYTRYLARNIGLDPDSDMKILAVGFGPSRMAALRTNQVDITIGDSPEADQIEIEGFGQLFINCAELPLFGEFPYTLLAVAPDFAEKQPEAVRRIVHTIGQANNLFHTDIGSAIDMLKKENASIDPKAIAKALERDKNAYPPDARMTQAMWDNNVKVAVSTKMINSHPSADEGVMWTNKFVAS